MATEQVETVIVGGGQAGLVTGYHLAKQGRPFVILDANERVGDAWRNRWDSLRLFTPAKFSGLDGWRFPAPATSFPTKDEMADYLEAYAERFALPVESRIRVDAVRRNGTGYIVTAGSRRYEADNVVVAAGSHQIPRVPDLADDLDPGIRQIHSGAYKSPSQLKNGPALVVGLGNSGAEIALEIVRTRDTFLSGEPSAELPFKHGPRMARFIFPVIRFVGHHVLTMRTPIGRKVGPKLVSRAAPLIRTKVKDLREAGVEQVERVVGVEGGLPELADGRVLDVANVIWCTGFREEFPWIDLDITGPNGRPRHVRGVVTDTPGLYFMGLLFQFAMTSEVLPGVGRDARYIAKQINERMNGTTRTERRQHDNAGAGQRTASDGGHRRSGAARGAVR